MSPVSSGSLECTSTVDWRSQLNRRVLSRVLPAKPLGFIGLFMSVVAAVLLWAWREPADGLPQHELLFGLMIYVLGPGGLTLAASSLVSGRPRWMVPAAVATYVAGIALFLIYAVNVGSISP